MEWKTNFIIVRAISNSEVAVVNESSTIKDSRYWLNYIAEPFDALHLTPINPKYNGNGSPTYSCHLIARAKTDYNEAAWRKHIGADDGKELSFVANVSSAASKVDTVQPPALSETEIIQLADGNPRSLSLDQLKAVISLRNANLKVVLSDATKWIDWESALTLMTKDVHVIGITTDTKWPLKVSLEPNTGKGETMNYDKEMKFVIRR